MIIPYVVSYSLMFGAVLSNGIMWPLISQQEGNWYPAGQSAQSFEGLFGYKVSHCGIMQTAHSQVQREPEDCDNSALCAESVMPLNEKGSLAAVKAACMAQPGCAVTHGFASLHPIEAEDLCTWQYRGAHVEFMTLSRPGI